MHREKAESKALQARIDMLAFLTSIKGQIPSPFSAISTILHRLHAPRFSRQALLLNCRPKRLRVGRCIASGEGAGSSRAGRNQPLDPYRPCRRCGLDDSIAEGPLRDGHVCCRSPVGSSRLECHRCWLETCDGVVQRRCDWGIRHQCGRLDIKLALEWRIKWKL